MKKRILILASLIFIALFIGSELRYPAAWGEIQIGMSQEEVVERIGMPSYDTGNIKGAYWSETGMATRHELMVYFDKGKASIVAIERRIGTNGTFYRQNVSSKYPPLGAIRLQ